MNAVRTIVSGLLLGITVSPALAATEITFTGADASNPTNLASAANWSAAPGAESFARDSPTIRRRRHS